MGRTTTLDHQQKHVFTRLPQGTLEKVVATADSFAKANGCTLLTKDTVMKHVPHNGRLQPVVCDKKTGAQLSPLGKYGGTKILAILACKKHFSAAKHVFGRDGVDSPMVGNEKQTFYPTAVQEIADSVAAERQLKHLYVPGTPTTWAAAASACKEHKIHSLNKKSKSATKEQSLAHAVQFAERGNVFLPIHCDDDGNHTLKFANKIKQDKRKYTKAVGTGFDIPIVDEYFANDTGSGLRLTSFLGRDGSEWQGTPDMITTIECGFFIITLYPDYFAQKIGKFTTPHRLETIVCIDVSTAESGGGATFNMPMNLQELAGMQTAESADEDDDHADGDNDSEQDNTEDIDGFLAERKRQKTADGR